MKNNILLLVFPFTYQVYAQNTVIKDQDRDKFQIDTGEKVQILGIDSRKMG